MRSFPSAQVHNESFTLLDCVGKRKLPDGTHQAVPSDLTDEHKVYALIMHLWQKKRIERYLQ